MTARGNGTRDSGFGIRARAGVVIAAVMLVALAATPSFAQSKKADKSARPVDNYDEMLQQFLDEARTSAQSGATSNSMWMAGLSSDLRARRVNDLITIRVVENVSGLGSADANLDKKSNGTIGVGSFFGLETKLPNSVNPDNLVTASANTTFQGGGSTSRSGSLTAVLSARVKEVLPNGDLLVQGVREIDINGDRQMLVLTGIVRTADINTANVVPSTAISQMRIRYFGRGLIKDNLEPGWLIKILNKIF
jgi:flagellar L-ring protein precursor FlgH